MRNTFLTLFILAFCACGQEKKNPVPPIKHSAETKKESTVTNRYEDLQGNPISLSDFTGKNVLLNFWATWCMPCIEEMPSLVRAKTLLGDENYVILLVSNQSVKKIEKFRAQKNFDLDFIRFNGDLSQLKIHALPKTFIYNKKGRKVKEISGAITYDSEEMLHELKNIQ